MSAKASAEGLPTKVLVDADVIISYLISDELSSYSEQLIDEAEGARVRLHAASEIYDDIITALRTGEASMNTVINILADIRKIPLEVLPTTPDIAAEAMMFYSQFGGPRRLHYFDSFHVATAKICEILLITSDRFILRNSRRLGIGALDLRKVQASNASAK